MTLPRLTLCSLFAAVTLFCLFLAKPASAGAVAVVVHPDNPLTALSIEEVKSYYTDRKTRWPSGGKVNVYDLPLSALARGDFSRKTLGRAPQDVAMEWANKRITNTAKNPPITVRSPILMLSKVSGDKNALGYLPVEMVRVGKVKVILTIQ